MGGAREARNRVREGGGGREIIYKGEGDDTLKGSVPGRVRPKEVPFSGRLQAYKRVLPRRVSWHMEPQSILRMCVSSPVLFFYQFSIVPTYYSNFFLILK